MPTRSIDYGQVESIAQDFYLPNIRDQYFLSNAIWYRLKQAGRVRMYDGARAIVQPLSFSPEGGGGQWWAGVDKMDIRVRNPITAATFFRKNFSVPIVITRDEADSVGNDGHKILDLVDAKMNIAKPTAIDAVGTELFNDGTDARRIGGLQFLTGITSSTLASGITSDQYGGISRTPSVATWWSPQQYFTSSIAGSSNNSFAGARGFGPVGILWSRIRKASGKSPTILLSNTAPYQDFHDSLAGTGVYGGNVQGGGQRYVGQDTALAKAGFENFTYKTAEWVLDERAPQLATVGCVFAINEDTLTLVIHSARNMSMDGPYTPADQRVTVSYIDWSGELVCSERRANGVIGNIDITNIV
jgi:hypothetical protein